jgi:hypothetical protein
VPLKLDESQEIPMARTWFENDGAEVTFDQVTEDNTFGLKMNKEIVINVDGDQLEPGDHNIYFGCIIRGIGNIGFDFNDVISSDKT